MNLVSSVDELQNEWKNPYLQWYAAGMPTFNVTDSMPWKQITLKFPTMEDRLAFAQKMDISLTEKTNVIHYPEKERAVNITNQLVDKSGLQPRYPIYIISKGRWESRYTMKALDKIGVDYRVAIEPQEYDQYAKVIDPKKLLVLPFSNHGKGSGPARNWCWEHSIAEGHKRHWLLDDNQMEFWRFHQNLRYRIAEGSAVFRAAEDFVDRFENVPLAGFQYKFFCVDNIAYPPYILNTRIMSTFLIENSCPHRWRGRYNEDVDLSIRVLKDGMCTMLFYSFLCGKMRTGTVKGGNTSEIYNNYEEDASLKKSQMLVEMHPDCVYLAERYGRVHHVVDLDAIYTKDGKKANLNKLILRKDVKIVNKVDNYGMKLIRGYGTDNEYEDPSYSENVYPTGRKNF